MNNDPVSLLVQAGLVGVFMLYVILTRRDDAKERRERDTSWQVFLAASNKTICDANEIIAAAMLNLADKFDRHNIDSNESFAVLLDRVRSPVRKSTTKE